jgi:hypothetical protein
MATTKKMLATVRAGHEKFGCYCHWPPNTRKLDSVDIAVAQPAEAEVPALIDQILSREASYTDGQSNTFCRPTGILDAVLNKGLNEANLRTTLDDVKGFLQHDKFFAQHYGAGIVKWRDEVHLIIAFEREERPDKSSPYNLSCTNLRGMLKCDFMKKGYRFVNLVEEDGDLNAVNCFVSTSGCYIRNVKPDMAYYKYQLESGTNVRSERQKTVAEKEKADAERAAAAMKTEAAGNAAAKKKAPAEKSAAADAASEKKAASENAAASGKR